MDNKNIYKLIRELRKNDRKVKFIREQLDGISKNKYYQLLPKAYKSEIDKLKKEGSSDEKICKILKITKTVFDSSMKGSPSKNKLSVTSKILRSDLAYRRIDNYRDFELYRGIIIEAISRINKSEEVFQSRKLSKRIQLTQKDMQAMINIDEERDNIIYHMGRLNNIIKDIPSVDKNQTVSIEKIRNHILLDLERLNAKINNNFYLESDQHMINIEELKCGVNKYKKDTTKDVDLIKKTIDDNIKIMNDKIKKKYNQKKITLKNDKQVIHSAITNDKIRVKKEIKNSQGNIFKLKNNLWAIGKIERIFKIHKSIIDNILMKNSMKYDSLMFGNNYCHQHKKDFIDILIQEIEEEWKVENSNHRKKVKNKYKGKNIELVKHYLLKYIQKPILKYSIDYSNTLLDEYNFEKVFLEIDMMIPKDEQKKLLNKMLEALYNKEIPYSYSDILIQSLLKDIKDEDFIKIYKGRKGKRHTSLSERVADIFYIYDAVKYKITPIDCADQLALFYKDKVSSVAETSVKTLHDSISIFMKNFEEKYKIQPSSLQR